MNKIFERIVRELENNIILGVRITYDNACGISMCFEHPNIETNGNNIIIEENSDRIEFDINDATKIKEDEYCIVIDYIEFTIILDFE